jgi:hypothetical protein
MEKEKYSVIDADTRLRLYLLLLNRYREVIKEKETKSVSEIRQLVSPYNNEFLQELKKKLLADMPNYSYEKNFYAAVVKAIRYMAQIRICEFTIPFWMSFAEIDELKITDARNMAIFFAALLRSFGSENVKVVITKSGKSYARFEWGGDNYLFVPSTGSLLKNEDISKLFETDPPLYLFSDLSYESYEE